MLHELRAPAGAGLDLNIASTPARDRTILLLHGLGRRWQDFLSLVAPLSARHGLVAADLPGHGLSDRSPQRYDLGLHTRSLAGLLDGLGAAPIVVVGHSLGALVALSLAATRPDRVAAIVLEDPPTPGYLARLGSTLYHATFLAMRSLAGSELPVAQAARLLADAEVPAPNGTTARLGQLRDPSALRFLASCLRLIDPAVFDPPLAGDWLGGISPIGDLLPRVSCPALMLVGQEPLGGMCPADEARAWASALPDACLVELPDLGHQIHATAPDLFARHVLTFLETLDPGVSRGPGTDRMAGGEHT
jgi:pimeloyl-ACP methyl ester carboxylesterase